MILKLSVQIGISLIMHILFEIKISFYLILMLMSIFND